MALQSCAYLTFGVYRRPRRSDQRMAAILKGSPVLRWQWAKVGELFGADLRSLTAFALCWRSWC